MEYHLFSNDHIGIFHNATIHIGHTLYDNRQEFDLKGWSNGKNTAKQTGAQFQSTQTGRADAWRSGVILFHLSTAIPYIHIVDYCSARRYHKGVRPRKLLQLPVLQPDYAVPQFGG